MLTNTDRVIEPKLVKTTAVELKLSSVTVVTNDSANIDFIADLVRRLNASC